MTVCAIRIAFILLQCRFFYFQTIQNAPSQKKKNDTILTIDHHVGRSLEVQSYYFDMAIVECAVVYDKRE
jgi:hypothetical protein